MRRAWELFALRSILQQSTFESRHESALPKLFERDVEDGSVPLPLLRKKIDEWIKFKLVPDTGT